MKRSRSAQSHMLSSRFRRLPFWRRLWLRLSPTQQSRVKSIGWAASAHFLLLAILAAIGLASPTIATIDLSGVIARAESVEAFELLAEAGLEELIKEELQKLEELPPSEDDVLRELLEVEIPLDQPTEKSTVDMEVQSAAALQQVSLPSVLSELTSEQEKIAETNRRVAAAGGMLDGPIRVSLIFSGDDDIDLHVQYEELGHNAKRRAGLFGFPMGVPIYHIFFANPRSQHAALDVDANAAGVVAHPCENIIFRSVPRTANYTVAINHYKTRGFVEPTPYVIVVNYGKQTRVFEGTILPRDGTKVIWTFKYSS